MTYNIVLVSGRSTEIRSQDCSNLGSGPPVGTMEAAQTLAWPNSDMSVLTKFVAAKVRSVLPEELVHSDVLQALSLQNQSWQYQFVVCVAARRDFSFSSFIVWPLGFSCGFSPTGVCSQGCPRSHESAPARKGYRRGGGCGHSVPTMQEIE